MIEDYLGDPGIKKDKINRCDDAKSALRYVIQKHELVPPALKDIASMVIITEAAYTKSNNWIKAAEAALKVIK